MPVKMSPDQEREWREFAKRSDAPPPRKPRPLRELVADAYDWLSRASKLFLFVAGAYGTLATMTGTGMVYWSLMHPDENMKNEQARQAAVIRDMSDGVKRIENAVSLVGPHVDRVETKVDVTNNTVTGIDRTVVALRSWAKNQRGYRD